MDTNLRTCTQFVKICIPLAIPQARVSLIVGLYATVETLIAGRLPFIGGRFAIFG